MGANKCDSYGAECPRTFTKGRQGLSALINTYLTCFLSWTQVNGAVLVWLKCSVENWKPASPRVTPVNFCLLFGIRDKFSF